MNILIISSNGDAAGVPRHVQCICENLSQNFKVYVHFLNEGIVAYELKNKNSVHFGNGYHDLIRFSAYKRDLKFILEKSIDVIHVHSFFGSVYGRLLGLFSGKRVIYTVHGYPWRGKNTFVKVLAYSVEFILNLIKKTDTIFVSRHTQNSGKWLPIRGRKTVIYNSSQAKFKNVFSGASREHVFKMCMVARVDHSKDHETFSKALREISANIEVSLIGAGTDEQEFKDKFSQNLPSNVHVNFLGEQANPWDMISLADLVLLISNFEAFPLTVLEAFSLGKPVIASDVGGVSEMFDTDQYLIPPKDVKKLTETINFFLRQPESELLRIGQENQRKFNEAFSVATMMQRIEEFYRL